MIPPGGPRSSTHYCKLSVLMLIVGGAMGYAYHSAMSVQACQVHVTNATRAAVLEGVFDTLHVNNPNALARQIDNWVDYESGVVSTATSPLASWFFTPTPGAVACGDGLFISGPTPSRANIALYLVLLLWSFIGVAIGADVFMVAIEMITSQEQVVERIVDGQYKQFTVLVWNGTIANLTLMALGSSAPEILLSVIEIVTSGFYAGALGPSTIVGSAAFNLLCISAVCVTAIPKSEGRLIKDRSVFAITAVFSVLAYLWLLVILMVTSPNVVEVWEGVVTFLLFPALVYLAYIADQGACSCGERATAGGKVVAISKDGREVDMDAALEAYGDSGLTEEEQQERVAQMLGRPKTRAYYRVNAVRAGTGGHQNETAKSKNQRADGRVSVEFSTAMLVPKMGEAFIELPVMRKGNLALTTSVGFRSVGQSTESKGEGMLSFNAFQEEAMLRLPMLRDEAAFYVVLVDPDPMCEIGATWSCAVLVEKDQSPGMLRFDHERLSVKESQGKIDVKIVRVGGAAGKVRCQLKTKDVTAIAPKDYLSRDETIIFRDGETEQTIRIDIIDDDAYEADETFQVILSDAEGGVTFDPTTDGGADKAVSTVTIISDEAVRRKVDELAALVAFNADDVALSANTWREQFVEAITYEGESPADVLIYLFALPWKIAFAITPPPRMMGGWLCFFVTLALIGLLTALIGDLAAHMGCCMGITPAITAITFVALGTSLPDTFASRTAAQSEPHADASIGNITGSNSVNVFLGLGLPWMLAAMYWGNVGISGEAAWRARYSGASWYTPDMPVGFVVEAADLAFSVAIFSICAVICLGVLVLRRACIGYELGGPVGLANATAAFFVFLWFVYIAACTLYTYGYFS